MWTCCPCIFRYHQKSLGTRLVACKTEQLEDTYILMILEDNYDIGSAINIELYIVVETYQI